MIKKIFLIALLLVSSSFAQENKSDYLDENKMDYINFRPFVGIDGGYAYLNTTANSGDLGSKLYSYSVYMGMPLFDYELILKYKNSNKDDFDLISNSLILNIPIDGSGTDMTYLGLIGGEGTLTWNNNQVTTLNLISTTVKDSFYGIHIGQKYKFSRNFYVRIELEYLQYDFITKTPTSKVSIDNTLEFIYGFEYKF
ncbi:MAG: hypothetical protein KAJ49_00080 [Arcobacteraceae bacterium]|nr:hypothetical protein [Arcobacteraceae bacterium]